MNVGELEDLLALLPADMPVYVSVDGPCRHVTCVDRMRRHRWDVGSRREVTLPDGSHPPALILRGDYGAPLWFEAWADDVPYEVSGRWPQKPNRRRRQP